MYNRLKYLFLAVTFSSSFVYSEELNSQNLLLDTTFSKSFLWAFTQLQSELPVVEQQKFIQPLEANNIALDASFVDICDADKALITPYAELMHILLAEDSTEALKRFGYLLQGLQAYLPSFNEEIEKILLETVSKYHVAPLSDDELGESVAKVDALVTSSYKLVANFKSEFTLEQQDMLKEILEYSSEALYGDKQSYLQFDQELCATDKEQLRPLIQKCLTEVLLFFSVEHDTHTSDDLTTERDWNFEILENVNDINLENKKNIV
jgi:hypothetical protein